MTPEEIARIESSVKIRSEEELIQKCEELGIPRSWYSFTGDKSCKVTLDGRSVFYGIMGMTTCAVRLCVYDVMFEKLLDCKKDYDFEQSDESLRIDSISIMVSEHIKEYKEYPYVVVTITSSGGTVNRESEQAYLDAGWEAGHYDQYMGYYVYQKTVDIHDIITDICISFTKRTEQRDKNSFGMTAPIMRGNFFYKVPSELLEEVARAKHGRLMPEELSRKIIDRYAGCIIDDEYRALLNLGPEYLKALKEVSDRNLSTEEQKDALREAARLVERNNRVYLNPLGSRGDQVSHNALCNAKKHLGI